MDYISKVQELVKKVLSISQSEHKPSGFCIGNTAKHEADGLYFTPIRNTSVMVTAGVIVNNIQQIIDIARVLNGRVQYILVDAEKKISDKFSLSGKPANVECLVRELAPQSTIWVYKGNDLSVEAVDSLLTQLTKNSINGIEGKQIAILGAGNIGSKLALKFVERGAHVTITRRNSEILKVVTQALNAIKPQYTASKVMGLTDNEKAAFGADILIGTTPGIPVINAKIVNHLANDAIIVDVGKGTLYPEAIITAEQKNLDIYRLDISPAFEGLVHKLWATEKTIETRFGRRNLCGEKLVSGGLLGREGEIVVDSVWSPAQIYGIANGNGDFIRNLSDKQISVIEKLKKQLEITPTNS